MAVEVGLQLRRHASAAAFVLKVLLARRRLWPLSTYHSNEPSDRVCRELCGRLGDEIDQAAW